MKISPPVFLWYHVADFHHLAIRFISYNIKHRDQVATVLSPTQREQDTRKVVEPHDLYSVFNFTFYMRMPPTYYSQNVCVGSRK